ncbi:MAG TPA: dienelactone hydrolase family protein [Rhizomicrobium sp.]|nr:dienelactone hydrolase family protein [Rhizomicrobium sp.]
MSEQTVTISTPDGQAPAKLFTPDDSKGPWPGVVYLTDIWGIRPANEKMARRVAGQGYAVLMPHLFYRTQPMTFDPLLKGQPRNMSVIGPLLASLPPAKMARDGGAYVDYLLQRPEVSGPRLAVVGYCFSGAMAVRTAAARPEKIAAAASFHGGRLVSDTEDSPHLLIPKISAELYFGHAVEDPSMTPEQIGILEDSLKAWGGTWQSEIYEGAKHGWAVEGRPEVYNPAQAERHYEKLFDLLKRTLK